jgi:hypothetical protein
VRRKELGREVIGEMLNSMSEEDEIKNEKTEEWRKIRSMMILNGSSPLYIEIARDEFFKEEMTNQKE